jgi:hypothetical protein
MPIRIDYGDDRAIRRSIFTLERKARFLSPAPENKLADSRAGSINRHHRLALRRQVFVEGLNYQELAMMKRFVLDGGYDCADYTRKLHFISQEP